MEQDTDRYTITTFDRNYQPDLYITGLDTKTAQIYVDALEEEGVKFELALMEA